MSNGLVSSMNFSRSRAVWISEFRYTSCSYFRGISMRHLLTLAFFVTAAAFADTEVIDRGSVKNAWTADGEWVLARKRVADIVVLDKKPLEQIENSDSVSLTVINGVVYDTESMDQHWPQQVERGKFYFQ